MMPQFPTNEFSELPDDFIRSGISSMEYSPDIGSNFSEGIRSIDDYFQKRVSDGRKKVKSKKRGRTKRRKPSSTCKTPKLKPLGPSQSFSFQRKLKGAKLDGASIEENFLSNYRIFHISVHFTKKRWLMFHRLIRIMITPLILINRIIC